MSQGKFTDRIFLSILFILSFVLVLALGGGLSHIVSQIGEKPAQAVETAPIPRVAYEAGEQQAIAPDWSRITWSTLPPIEESGWIQIPANLVAQLNYDPSRSWTAGQKPDSFVMLGDVEDAFHFEKFKLQDIFGLTNLAIDTLKLNDFGLIRWQTTKSLVEVIPGLGDFIVSQVKPIRDLFVKAGQRDLTGSIAEALEQYPVLGQVALEQLDLSQYSLESIPGLVQTPLEEFAAWQQSFINQVPGLNSVPFNQFPQPAANGIGIVGIIDVVWGASEHGAPKVGSDYFISGSVNKQNETVPTACEPGESCPYIELSDVVGASGSLYGKRWASGDQKVKGGFGPLGIINNNWEPTGRLVYGPAFKMVLTSTNESNGTADFSLYLRVCGHSSFVGKSCTPYFIGPIPWMTTREKSWLIVSAVD